jgi:hypothetical protein
MLNELKPCSWLVQVSQFEPRHIGMECVQRTLRHTPPSSTNVEFRHSARSHIPGGLTALGSFDDTGLDCFRNMAVPE